MRFSFLLFFSVLIAGKHSILAQSATWPFTNVSRPNCSSMPPATPTSCTISAVRNGEWKANNTWDKGRPPTHRDIVCIPSGITVTVDGPTYTAYNNNTPCPASNTVASPDLYIFICGTLNFNSGGGGKLNLGCNSSVSILPPNGKAIPHNSNSDLIRIGKVDVWRDNNTQLNGPYCVCNGCPPNNAGCSYSAPLPAQLVSFTATQKNQYQIDLRWSTLQEVNFDNFIVEKSLNGTGWSEVGIIKAKGGENLSVSYSFTDSKPSIGPNYYRLKNYDRDGHYEYSNVIQVNFKEALTTFSVFPNPAKDKVTIYAKAGFDQGMQIQLYHKNGMLLETKFIQSANAQTMDISNLSNGIYFMRIVDAKGTMVHTQSIIKN